MASNFPGPVARAAKRRLLMVQPLAQRGLVQVVGRLEPRDLPPDFSSLDVEDGPLGLSDDEPQ